MGVAARAASKAPRAKRVEVERPRVAAAADVQPRSYRESRQEAAHAH
jgi:hypothetical protein